MDDSETLQKSVDPEEDLISPHRCRRPRGVVSGKDRIPAGTEPFSLEVSSKFFELGFLHLAVASPVVTDRSVAPS